MRLVATVLLLLLSLLLVPGCVRKGVVLSEDASSFCGFVRAINEDVTWQQIHMGSRIRAPEAFLTCDASEIVIKTDRPLSESISWSPEGNRLQGRIPAARLVLVEPPSAMPNSLGVEVEIIAIRGSAFYSDDLVRKNGPVWVSPWTGPSPDQLLREFTADLDAIQWEPLGSSRELKPWNMIRTGPDGKVEIEITKDGPRGFVDARLAVVGSDGQPTRRIRLMPKSYLVMFPEIYDSGLVTAAVGQVLLARQQDQVRDFFSKRPYTSGFMGMFDMQLSEERQRMLRKPRLE
jgi:hypothetical protein